MSGKNRIRGAIGLFSKAVFLLSALAVPTVAAFAGEQARCSERAIRKDATYFEDLEDLDVTVGQLGFNPASNQIPEERREFCSRTHDSIRTTLLEHTFSSTFSFVNPNGDLGTGLCWAHSKFQRNAAYLARFRSELPRPDAKERKRIAWALSRGDSVVEIPGYANFNDYSLDNKSLIETTLNSVSNSDFFSGRAWTRLQDEYRMAPDRLRAHMDELYRTSRHFRGPRFLRIKSKEMGSLGSHGLLLLKLEPIRESGGNPLARSLNITGYRLSFIDSNNAWSVLTAEYREGETAISYCTHPEQVAVAQKECRTMVPYAQFDEDMDRLAGVVQSYCVK